MKVRVVLYSKPGCHLCDEMKAEIGAAGCDDLFALDEVDIEADPQLLARYRDDIPVLFINGVQAFQHRVTADRFRRAIQEALNVVPAQLERPET